MTTNLAYLLLHDRSMVSRMITKGGILWPLHDTSFIQVIISSAIKEICHFSAERKFVERYSNLKTMHK
jgi:hypothetical protein